MKKPNRNYSFILQREKERLVRIATNRYKISNAILKKKKKKEKKLYTLSPFRYNALKTITSKREKKEKGKKKKEKTKHIFP